MKQLLGDIREACLPAIWAQGTKLAGADAVRVERSDAGEVVLRVQVPARPVPPTVVLYPDDLEWACDCGGNANPCAHVAAAAVALGKAAESGGELPAAARTQARLEYRLDADRLGNLVLERWLLHADGSERRLEGLLERADAELSPSHEDLALDRMLAVDTRGIRHRGPGVVGLLAGSPRVRWAGEPVELGSEPFEPRALVRDHDSGVELRIDPDPELEEVVARGIGRAGETLRPLGHTSLTGDRLERLPLSRVFTRPELGELVGTVLPEIDKQIPVDIRTSRLPGRERSVRPRIALQIDHEEHTLSVLPALVYGDPPVARIDSERLVHLTGPVPTRDEVEERKLLARLRDELDLVPGRRVHFDGRDAVRYAARLRAWQSASGESLDPHVVRREPLVAHLSVDGDDFEISFESAGAGAGKGAPRGRAAPEAVLRAWRDGLDLVPLDTGGWAPLPVDWLERFGDRVADLLAARREDGVPTAALPTLASLADELEQPRPPGFERLAPLLVDSDGIPPAELPADLTATLRHYQRHGVDWLSFLRRAELGGVLADDMGLGKTLQALCAVSGRTLVVCPKQRTLQLGSRSPALPSRSPRRPLPRPASPAGSRRRADHHQLSAAAHGCRPPGGRDLGQRCARRGAGDQESRQPGCARSVPAHGAVPRGAQRHARREPSRGTLESAALHQPAACSAGAVTSTLAMRVPSASATPRRPRVCRQRVRPFILRRLKRDVAPELPPRTDVVLHVELDERERDIYEAVRAASRREVVARAAAGRQRAGGARSAPAAAAGRLSQRSGARAERRRAARRSRLCCEALEDAAADGHKALVFSQWTSLLDRIEPALTAAGIAFTRLDGSTRDRAGVVAAFQSESGPPVLLASLKAGGTGLNLTAADHVFLLDPWWNPAARTRPPTARTASARIAR